MSHCQNCGTPLYALNIDDDDESLCQNCANEIKRKLFEDLETTLVLWEKK